MPLPTAIFGFSPSTPAAPSGRRNVNPKTDGAFPISHFSFDAANHGGVLLITGTSDTIDQSRNGLLTRYSAATAIAVAINAPTESDWMTYVSSTGAGSPTFTPSGGALINNGATFNLSAGGAALIFWDGTNFWAEVTGGTGTTSGSPAPFNTMLAPTSVVPPVLASLTWANQGSASASYNAGGALYMTSPGSGGINVVGLYKSAPATPWSLTIGVVPGAGSAAAKLNEGGLFLRESATGKILGIWVGTDSSGSAPILIGDRYTNYTTFNNNAFAGYQFWPCPIAWLKVTNNGTNILIASAIDGQTFKTIYSEALTASFTTAPDEVGIGIAPNGVSSTWITDALFVHWTGI